MQPWWERDAERYEYELDALTAAGMAWTRDEEAFAQGFLRLNVDVEVNGERLPLRVTFPDLFPYFRFEVEAPTLSLPHHQNPFQKNLCLMGRATFHWHTSDTVAGVLREQLPKVIETGRSDDGEQARGLEQEQAEPYSDYYPCAPSMVVLPGKCLIPDGHDHGTFRIVTDGPQGPPGEPRFLRGVLTALRGKDGRVLVEAGAELSKVFSGREVEGCWARLASPIAQGRPDAFLKELLQQVPSSRQARINRVEGAYLQVWGIAFPEETTWRREDGLGWVFVCLFGPVRKNMVNGGRAERPVRGHSKPKSKGKKGRARNKRRGRR